MRAMLLLLMLLLLMLLLLLWQWMLVELFWLSILLQKKKATTRLAIFECAMEATCLGQRPQQQQQQNKKSRRRRKKKQPQFAGHLKNLSPRRQRMHQIAPAAAAYLDNSLHQILPYAFPSQQLQQQQQEVTRQTRAMQARGGTLRRRAGVSMRERHAL